jgi:hypothetical protein
MQRLISTTPRAGLAFRAVTLVHCLAMLAICGVNVEMMLKITTILLASMLHDMGVVPTGIPMLLRLPHRQQILRLLLTTTTKCGKGIFSNSTGANGQG